MMMLSVLLNMMLTTGIPEIKEAVPFDSFFEKTYSVMPSSEEQAALLGNVNKVVIFNDKLIVLCRDMEQSLKVFDVDSGSFIQNVSQKGSGPGEYVLAEDIFVHNNQLLVLDRFGAKVIFFDKGLDLVSEVKISDLANGAVQSFKRFGSSTENELFLFDVSSKRSEKNVALIEKGQVSFFGDVSFAQKVSQLRGGGAFVTAETIYFLGSLDSDMQMINRVNGVTKTKSISLPTWPVVNTEDVATSFTRDTDRDVEMIREYVRKNLSPISVNHCKDWLVIDYGAFLICYSLKSHKTVPVKYKHHYGVIGNVNECIAYAAENDEDQDANPIIVMYKVKKES